MSIFLALLCVLYISAARCHGGRAAFGLCEGLPFVPDNKSSVHSSSAARCHGGQDGGNAAHCHGWQDAASLCKRLSFVPDIRSSVHSSSAARCRGGQDALGLCDVIEKMPDKR